MWIEFLLSIMATGIIACAAYFHGYDKGHKDAGKESNEKHENEH